MNKRGMERLQGIGENIFFQRREGINNKRSDVKGAHNSNSISTDLPIHTGYMCNEAGNLQKLFNDYIRGLKDDSYPQKIQSYLPPLHVKIESHGESTSYLFNTEFQVNYTQFLTQCIRDNLKSPSEFARYALTRDIRDPFSFPRDDLSKSDIAHSLQILPNYWYTSKDNPEYAPLIKVFLDEHKKASAILIDNILREDLSRKIKSEYRCRLKAIWRNLDDMIDGLTRPPKDFITLPEMEELGRIFTTLSGDQIRSRINKRKISIKENSLPKCVYNESKESRNEQDIPKKNRDLIPHKSRKPIDNRSVQLLMSEKKYT